MAQIEALSHGQLAANGKTLCNSFDAATGKKALHLAPVWSTMNRLVLGPFACAEKSNEITAISVLLAPFDLTGAFVSIDAMGCQKEIAQTIVDQEGDSLLAVKGNQPTLEEPIATVVLRPFTIAKTRRRSAAKDIEPVVLAETYGTERDVRRPSRWRERSQPVRSQRFGGGHARQAHLPRERDPIPITAPGATGQSIRLPAPTAMGAVVPITLGPHCPPRHFQQT